MCIYLRTFGLIAYNSLIIVFFLILNTNLFSQSNNVNSEFYTNWVIQDPLFRDILDFEFAENRPQKKIGLFYWSWHQGHFAEVEPRNISEILERDYSSLNNFEHPLWEGKDGRHFWGEPLFGYYRSTDKWVARKHAEMLADSKIDVVFFDTTNPPWLWDESLEIITSEWIKASNEGIKVPKIAFMMPFTPNEESKEMITRLYKTYYASGKFKSLWFYWKGKPLILGYPDNISKKIKEFFTFRPPQPDYRKGPSREDHWGWLEEFPQNGYVVDKYGFYEQTTVGVSQNATDELVPAAMNSKNQVYGRSYTKKRGHTKDSVNYGLNFQEQWERALELDPQLIFVTGWNEWTAGRYRKWQGTENAFPDQFNQEYSRDIEPMKNGHKDYYYIQLIKNIERFKGSNKLTPITKLTMNIDGDFSDWKKVKLIFHDHKANLKPRHSQGYGSTLYQLKPQNIDFLSSKVCHDSVSLYFFLKFKTIKKLKDNNSVTLLIDFDRDFKTGWNGYDLSIEFDKTSESAIINKNIGNQLKWKVIEKVRFKLDNSSLEFAISKHLLEKECLSEFSGLEFKWISDFRSIEDATDFYWKVEVAPSGRFNYFVFKDD